ncbi:MAG TPA: tetratricopeptide repeat protein [Candidatus Hydrogenedentes bacterium]|nr:tetratricopeptide repeat protein [Candidatus Hydrogenedentota bacterium]
MTRDELRSERERAERLVVDKRYAEAAEVYRTVLAQDDTYAKAWYGIGYCYYKLGNLDQSRLSMREARRRGYGPAEYMLRRIHQRVAVGADAPALATATPAILPDPGTPQGESREPLQTPSGSGTSGAVVAQAMRRLSASRDALRKQLDDLCLSLATKAEALDGASDWPETAAVREARAGLEHAERQLKDRRDLLRQAHEGYQQKKAARRSRIDKLREAVTPLEAAVNDAQEKIAAITAEIAAADEGIRAALKAGTGIASRTDSPIHRFEEARAGAAKSLAAAGRQLETAIAARGKDGSRLQAAEHAWRKERAMLKQDIIAIQAGCAHAEKQAEAARASYKDALCRLGRVALGAAKRLPPLAEQCAEGKRLVREIAEAEAALEEKRRLWDRAGGTAGH